ncbi:hypothetical protein GRF29_154g985611 [Pseudopithomyces chartarum]|uniref:Ubiquitin 3 binding protein But2 C-terminal domain-containing protein n=1 Tax=Pseudopithomyces chartarum TaxID=1892770 RepID=A0AAN6REP6_9PLEO|nr:hypothetical protein GRF29_154g985611 [Pseudopithomyces chartarum]
MRAILLTSFGFTVLADKLWSRNFPHLIIPLRADAPFTPQGTAKSFEVSKEVWSAASWDVPLLTAATYCGLGFSINQDPKLGAPWELSGVEDDEAFLINISELPNDSLNKDKDTWDSHPWPQPNSAVGILAVYKSGFSNITWYTPIDCQRGQVAQFLLQPSEPYNQPDAKLTWFELDYHPPHGITYDLYGPDWVA